jgi:hypothetical protein
MKDMSFHLSTFVGGEMYLASDIVPTLGELPGQHDDLKAQPDSIDAMKTEATKHLVLEKGESLEFVSKGRAYLPQLDFKPPIITKLLWEDLYSSNSAGNQNSLACVKNSKLLRAYQMATTRLLVASSLMSDIT